MNMSATRADDSKRFFPNGGQGFEPLSKLRVARCQKIADAPPSTPNTSNCTRREEQAQIHCAGFDQLQAGIALVEKEKLHLPNQIESCGARRFEVNFETDHGVTSLIT